MTGSTGESKVPELTIRVVILGIILAVLMTAANTYLGLYAGMTVSASIPAAVISMAVMRGIMKKGTILENNIVQTIASAGESLAAGIIFTVPALVLVGAWQEFRFWPTTIIAMTGGLLGIIFMIPVRRALIVEEKELTYPEGVACAEVLRAGEQGGGSFAAILKGLVFGGAVKFLTTGLRVMNGSVEYSLRFMDRAILFGSDISPALLGVGYIINLEVAFLVFLGGMITWLIGIPLTGIPADLSHLSAGEVAWELWSSKVRFIGVGAMVTGGIWSIFSVRHGIRKGVNGLIRTAKAGRDGTEKMEAVARTEKDISLVTMGTIFLATLVAMTFLYDFLTGQMGLSVITTLLMAVAGFFFVAVSSYIVGLVGSSNNPISGMTISTLLGVSALFLVLGWKGDSAILATLGIAGVVCCAASSAGDVSQDLKTGYLLGATPRNQQLGQVIGVLSSAFVIAPVLTLLHSAYGIGQGLKAPQATLFASITGAMFGNDSLPMGMVIIGLGVGVLLIVINQVLIKTGSSFRTHVMPVAVGMYLPITLAVPMLAGGVIRHIVEKRRKGNADEGSDMGILLSSGMIAGEAVVGIILALFIVLGADMVISTGKITAGVMSLTALAAAVAYLYRTALSGK